MKIGALILVFTCFKMTTAYYTLKQLSHIQLPTSINSGANIYGGLNLGAATDAAYDPSNNIIYILGANSHYMHVVDIADPSNPTLLFTHTFTTPVGIPRSIDICGNEIAVALEAQTSVNEGHVKYFHTYTRGSGATDVITDGYITVGPNPSHLKYTADCGSVIVANEGNAGTDETGQYVDPQGSISIIHGEKTGNPSVKLVDFTEFNTGQTKYNPNLRTPSLYVPPNLLSPMTTVAQDLEPEYVTISNDGRTAYVTLQENNAVAEISISTGVVTKVSPLPKKDWTTSGIDTSDRDGGVHRRLYTGLQSLRQPGAVKSLEIGSKKFLFTADEGAVKSFTSSLHGFTWTDMQTAKSMGNNIDPALTDLKANVSNDELLGRIQVSNIDGKNPISQMFQHLEIFGGRGFSIWDSSNFASPVYDSAGTLGEYMDAAHNNVYNTDYLSNLYYQSPEQHKDQASYKKGAQVSSLDVASDNGTVFLIVGTWSTGTLYTYTVDVSSGTPYPQFQSIVRSGITDLPWRDLYREKSVGDLYITDIGVIKSANSPTKRPLLYVVSTGAGALSLYAIENIETIIPGPAGN